MLKLNQKNIDIKKIGKKAISNKKILSELLEGILNKESTIRENSFYVLNYISKENPEVIYSEFNYFIQMLKSSNTYHQNIAINIIANLACSDPDKKFDEIFNEYFSLFKSEKTIVPAQVAKNSGKIAKKRIDLRNIITEKLLNIDKLHSGKQKELIKSYIIESFDEYFKDAENKEEILKFVNNQINNNSPKTKKAAQNFLKKWQK